MKNWHLAATLAAGLVYAASAHADEWKQELTPYLWGSNLQGSVTVGSVTAGVDLGFGDILDKLEMGFMGAYRVSNDRWSVTLDAMYMGLGATSRGANGLLASEMDVDQMSIELAAEYAVTDHLTVLGGLRYADVEARIAVNGPSNTLVKASSAHSWVDPIVGLQYRVPLSSKWSLALRGDVGGFGIGSDLAWQGIATVRFDLSENIAAVAAYRYIDTNYDSGSGSSYFRYDVVTAGPALGLTVAF